MSWLWAVVVIGLSSPASSRVAPEVSWAHEVSLKDLSGKGQVEVISTFEGFYGHVRLCLDVDEGVDHLFGIEALGTVNFPVTRAPKAPCWWTRAPENGPLVVRYRVDLAGFAAAAGDPDRVLRVDGGFVLTEQAFLLRPDPLPTGASVRLQFLVPAGQNAVTPWAPDGTAKDAYRATSEQLEGGSYLVFGRVQKLPPLRFGKAPGHAELTRVEGRHRASDAALRRWVERAAGSVVAFFGDVPGDVLEVLLVPASGSTKPGVFGSVMHRGRPSAVLFFGAEAEDRAFDGDWMATHELFHAGIPFIEGRPSWFVEGLATYYQDVLRARTGAQPSSAMWADLADGCERFGDPVDGVSLDDESRRMRTDHSYQRVYWGGACALFQLDVAIRRRSGGTKSLDDVARRLHARGTLGEWSEREVREALDAEAGPGAVERLLDARTPSPWRPLFHDLGVEPTSAETANLSDNTPLAPLRRRMF